MFAIIYTKRIVTDRAYPGSYERDTIETFKMVIELNDETALKKWVLENNSKSHDKISDYKVVKTIPVQVDTTVTVRVI